MTEGVSPACVPLVIEHDRFGGVAFFWSCHRVASQQNKVAHYIYIESKFEIRLDKKHMRAYLKIDYFVQLLNFEVILIINNTSETSDLLEKYSVGEKHNDGLFRNENPHI